MNIRYHDIGQTGNGVRRIVRHHAALIDKRLADVEDDLKQLDVKLHYYQRRDAYTAHLVLRICDHELAATGSGIQRATAVLGAFRDLADELEEYLAKLRGEPAIRREGKTHRDKADQAAQAIAAAQGWPSETPHSAEEARTWGMTPEQNVARRGSTLGVRALTNQYAKGIIADRSLNAEIGISGQAGGTADDGTGSG
jgi:hypothetical protein